MTLKPRSILQIFAFSLFFLIGFSLFGQSIEAFQASSRQIRNASKEDSFFVLPIRGDGSREEKAWFYDRLVYELVLQRYAVAAKRSAGDYTIRGTLDGEEGFLIELIRNRTNEILTEKHLFYTVIDDSVAREISVIIFDMLNNIPESGVKDRRTRAEETEEDDEADEKPEIKTARPQKERKERVRSDDWRDKLLFIEYSLLWAPRENYGFAFPPESLTSSIADEINYLNLGVNLALEMQFLPFLAWEIGAQIVQETAGGKDNRDLLFEYYFAGKLVLKPFKNFMIELYGGICVNQLSIIGNVEPSMYSFFGGLELCINTKGGIFVIDPRFAYDLKTSDLGFTNNGDPILGKRRMLQLGIGYKKGLITKLVNVN